MTDLPVGWRGEAPENMNGARIKGAMKNGKGFALVQHEGGEMRASHMKHVIALWPHPEDAILDIAENDQVLGYDAADWIIGREKAGYYAGNRRGNRWEWSTMNRHHYLAASLSYRQFSVDQRHLMADFLRRFDGEIDLAKVFTLGGDGISPRVGYSKLSLKRGSTSVVLSAYETILLFGGESRMREIMPAEGEGAVGRYAAACIRHILEVGGAFKAFCEDLLAEEVELRVVNRRGNPTVYHREPKVVT